MKDITFHHQNKNGLSLDTRNQNIQRGRGGDNQQDHSVNIHLPKRIPVAQILIICVSKMKSSKHLYISNSSKNYLPTTETALDSDRYVLPSTSSPRKYLTTSPSTNFLLSSPLRNNNNNNTNNPTNKCLFGSTQQTNSASSRHFFSPVMSRQIKTSGSRRGHKIIQLPRQLQMELRKDEMRSTFITDISNPQMANTSSEDLFMPEQSHSFTQNSQSWAQRNFSSFTQTNGNNRKSILQSRWPIDLAINSVKAASNRLEKFFQSAIRKQEKKDLQKAQDKDLQNFSFINTSKQPQKSPKSRVEHGLRRATQSRGQASYQGIQTLSHIPQLLQSLDDIEQEESQANKPEQYLSFKSDLQLRQAVKKIDASKGATLLSNIMATKIGKSREISNGLFMKLEDKTKQLQGLSNNNQKLEQMFHREELKELNQKIQSLQKEIEFIENNIVQVEMDKITLASMRDVRYKDKLLKQKLNIELMLMHRHISEYLREQCEEVREDAKYLDTLCRQLSSQQIENDDEIKRQNIKTKDLENKSKNELDAVKLSQIEQGMRLQERNQQNRIKKEQQLLVAQKNNFQIEETKRQSSQCRDTLKHFNDVFESFHNQNPTVSSYQDLLAFTMHVKQSIETLKEEKNDEEQKVQQLRTEISELTEELKLLELENPVEFEIEKTREDILNRKDEILKDNNINKPTRRQSDITKNADMGQPVHSKRGSQVISLDTLETDNLLVAKYRRTVLEDQEKSLDNLLFKTITGLSDLHTHFFSQLNDISLEELIALKKKKFDSSALSPSIEAFSNSIQILNGLVKEKQAQKRKEQSLNFDEEDEEAGDDQEQYKQKLQLQGQVTKEQYIFTDKYKGRQQQQQQQTKIISPSKNGNSNNNNNDKNNNTNQVEGSKPPQFYFSQVDLPSDF